LIHRHQLPVFKDSSVVAGGPHKRKSTLIFTGQLITRSPLVERIDPLVLTDLLEQSKHLLGTVILTERISPQSEYANQKKP
jgi:hypothetical protein